MRKLSLLLVVPLVALAACGDDGGGSAGGFSDAEQEYIDAALATFDPEEADPLTEDDARCIVETMVSDVGVDRLEELGITAESFGDDDTPFPSGFSEDEADKIADGFNDCFDVADLFLAGMADDASLSDEDRACLEDAFDEETVHKLFATMLQGGEAALSEDPELSQELLGIFSACPGALGG